MKQHIYNLADAHLPEGSIVTIGVFDGVHRGHQHLIQRLVEQSHAAGRLAVVLTFFPHPDIVLRGLKGRYYLTTAEKKAQLLLSLGVNCVVTHPFNDEVRQIRAASFVEQLKDHLRMEELWVGSDFAMGYKREGDVNFLRHEGTHKGFSVHEVDLLTNGGDTISSTAIREALIGGYVEQTAEWLGRAYAVSGTVVDGKKRGRQIGFPTANIQIWDEQVLPAHGVYAGWAWLGNERFMAATNVGIVPHFEGDKTITVEPYLLDFDRDIYGQQLEVTFETRLRDEAKFTSLQELIDQIGRDVDNTRSYLTSC